MAVAQIGRSSVEITPGVYSIVVAPDGTIADGDWMLAVVVAGQSQVLAVPSGWTQVSNFNMNLAGTLSTGVFMKKRLAGETSYTFTVSGSTTSCKISLMWFRGAADTGWIIGTPRNRSTTGSTFNNIADSITTQVANTLALTISTERTSAAEAGISSMTNADPWFFHAQVGTTQIETIATGTRLQAAPGATPAVTIAYPNTQASNGWAVQIGIPPLVTAPAITGPLSRWNGSVEEQVNAKLWNGAAEVAITPAQPAVGNYHIADLIAEEPFYIAHRGGGDNWPEHTMRAYKSAVNWGLKAIEVSVNIASDGVMFCHHDTTTTRMTGTALTIGTSTAAQLEALTNTAALTDNPAQDRQPIPRLTAVLAAYASNHVLFIEAKTGGAWQADLIALIQTYPDIANRIVWKAPIIAGFASAKAAGFTTWGYLLHNDPAHADVQTLVAKTDVDWIGVNHAASDAYILDVAAQADALGKRVIMWEVHSPADRDRAASLGVVGMMTSNLKTVLPKFP